MTRSESLKLLREICEDILEKDCVHTREDDEFANIGLDSMGSIELVDVIEKRLGILIPDQLLVGVKNVGQLLNVVEMCDKNRDYWAPERLAAPA